MTLLSDLRRALRNFSLVQMVLAGLGLGVACLPQSSSPTCQGGQVDCNGVCVSVTSDPQNCGACGNACGAGLVCSQNTCSATCGAGLENCNSACVVLASDPNNCGACGNACASGSCVNGVCAASQGTGGGGPGVGGGGPGVGGTGDPGAGGGTPGVGGAGDPGSGGAGPGAGGSGTGGEGEEGPITGYFESGPWHGFGFTSLFSSDANSGNTIEPPNFEGVETWPMCAKGTIKPPSEPDGWSGALVGWGINQERVENAPLGTVTPTKEGIILDIQNKSATQLRLQIQGPDGATDANQRWCAEIGATSNPSLFVAYETFNTECWAGGNGKAYNGEPLSQIIVQAQSIPDSTADVNFDFCVNNISEGNGNIPTVGCDVSGAPAGGQSGTLSSGGGAFQRVTAVNGPPTIAIQNNIFSGGGSYNITYNGASFSVTNFSGNRPTTDAPVGYPSFIFGSNGGDGFGTAGSNLPKSVGQLNKIPTGIRWSGGGSGEYNVAYDVWFSPGGADGGPGSRSFLMVWLDRSPNVYAEGQGQGESGGTLAIGGRTFAIYVSRQFEGRPIISYVATSRLNEFSFDLNDFIKDAKTRTSTTEKTPVINDSMSLTNVFVGFEVWSGASNLKIDNFCISNN